MLAPPSPESYTFRNKVYDLTVADVADVTGRGTRWVYLHRSRLGGLKRPWRGGRRETLLFPSEDLARHVEALGLTSTELTSRIEALGR